MSGRRTLPPGSTAPGSTARGRRRGPREEAERRAEASTALDGVARVGMCTDGLAHLAVAWLVARLAWGDTSGAASGGGVMDRLSVSAEGRVVLVAVAVGFLAQAVWQGVEARLGYRRYGRQRRGWRVLSGLKAVVYLGFVAQLVRTAVGSPAVGGSARGPTGRALELPAGPYLVGAVGVGILVAAACLARFGWVEGFRDTMSRFGASGRRGRCYAWLGKVGYVSRAAAVGAVGLLVVHVATSGEAGDSGGLDAALNDVLTNPVGAPLVFALALGLASYGVFCFAWARHLDR